eukprot:gene33639-45055_t
MLPITAMSPTRRRSTAPIRLLLRATDQDADREHDDAAEHDLEYRLHKRRIHIPGADPGDRPQLEEHHDAGDRRRNPERIGPGVGHQIGQGVAEAADGGHQAADAAAQPRRAASGHRAIVGQRFGKSHADAGADGGGETDKAKAELDALKARDTTCAGKCPESAALRTAVTKVETALAAPAPTPTSSLLFGDPSGVERGEGFGPAALDAASRVVGPHPDIFTYRGYVLRRMGQLDEAEGWYRAALAIAPNHRGATEYYGELKILRGDIAGAIDFYEQAIQRGPRWADPQKYWGDALMAQGDEAGAIRKYRAAADRAPQWGALHLAWGRALEAQGKRDQAREKYSEAARMDLSATDRAEVVRRGDELLLEAKVKVAFVSGGRARPIPKALRTAMKADQL